MRRILLAILCLLPVLHACADDGRSTTDGGVPADATEQGTPASALLAGDLARAVGLLRDDGCLDAAAATALTEALTPGTPDAVAAFAGALDDAGVCDGGALLLQAAAKGPLLLAFEPDGVVFDRDGDGCYDSTLVLPGSTAVSHDADGDGCRDQLDHLPALVEALGLPDAVAEAVLGRAAEVSLRMVPLPYWREPWASPPGEGFDWPAFRAEAEPRLDELVAHVGAEVADAAARERLLTFLENVRPTVATFPAYAPPPFTQDGGVADAPGKADDPVGYVDQKWLCLYVYSDRLEDEDPGPLDTFFGHAFVGLSQGNDEWRRGHYLYGHGMNGGAIPKVPDAGAVTGDGTALAASKGDTVKRSSQPSFLGLENAVVVGPGDVRDNGGDLWHYRVCWKITDAEWDAVAAAMNAAVVNPPAYQLFQGPGAPGQNCVTWAASLVALIGRRVPDGSKLGNGSPYALANSIQKLLSSGRKGGADRVEKYEGCGDGIVQTALGESCEKPVAKCSVFAYPAGSTVAKEVAGVCSLSCRCEVVSPELGEGTFVAQGCYYDWDCPKVTAPCWERHCQKPLPGAHPQVGSCAPRPSTAACDDGDPCTTGDHCEAGACVGGPSCGDGTTQPDCGEACDPAGSPCGGGVFHEKGTCTAQCTCETPDLPHTGLGILEWTACETDADCAAMKLPPCWSAVCDPVRRACEPKIAPWGEACDDGDACTEGDSCKHLVDYAGYVECTGTQKACDDDDGCTLDACDPATGACSHTQDPAQDADGDGVCDGRDVCPKHADPAQKDTDGDGIGDACECAESDCGGACQLPCNPETGACDPKPDGAVCDDGVKCTLGDACAGGACKPGPISGEKGCCKEAADCNDGNPCTNDACEKPVGQCINENLGVLGAKPPCEDGDPCTTGDHCDVGVCKPGQAVTCDDDGDPCTADACSSATGGCHDPLPDGTACDDGDACTEGDSCQGGACQGTPKEVCCEGPDQAPTILWTGETAVPWGAVATLDASGSVDPDDTCDGVVDLLDFGWFVAGAQVGAGPVWSVWTGETEPGVLDVELRVTDGEGGVSVEVVPLEILPVPPAPQIQVAPGLGHCGEAVILDGSASAPQVDHSLMEMEWTIPGSGVVFAAGPKAELPLWGQDVAEWIAAGSVTVELTMTGPTGTATASVAIPIGNQPPVAVLEAPEQIVLGGELSASAAGSYDPDAPCGDLLSIQWTLDGALIGSGGALGVATASLFPDGPPQAPIDVSLLLQDAFGAQVPVVFTIGVVADGEVACGNGLDDDADGLADCADPDCAGQGCGGDGVCGEGGFCAVCCVTGKTYVKTAATVPRGECAGTEAPAGECAQTCCRRMIQGSVYAKPSFSSMPAAECADQDGTPADAMFCTPVCCNKPEGHVVVSAWECSVLGSVAPDEACSTQVCCKSGPDDYPSYAWSVAGDCPAPAQAPDGLCAKVCCRKKIAGTPLDYGWDTAGNCVEAAGRTPVGSLECGSVCCKTGTSVNQRVRGLCLELGGEVLPDLQCGRCCDNGTDVYVGSGFWSCSGAELPLTDCEEACCKPPGGGAAVMLAGQCARKGGTVDASGDACSQVCCKQPAGASWRTASTCEAEGGAPVEGGQCAEVCCEPPLGASWTTTVGTCAAAGGQALGAGACVCCHQTVTGGSGYSVLPRSACEAAAADVVGPQQDCDPVCCEHAEPPPLHSVRVAAECAALGEPVPMNQCEPAAACCLPNAGCTVMPGASCVQFGGTLHPGAACSDVDCPGGEQACANELDDDADGLADCADADCAGQPCGDDGSACTADVCGGGTCNHPIILGCCTSDADCDDGDPCTANVCELQTVDPPMGSCAHPWSDETCCKGASDCDDGKPCTFDLCSPDLASKLWTCDHLPIEACEPCASDADCDDGDACNGAEWCAQGKCAPGDAPDCDLDTPCLQGACDPATGCTAMPLDGVCDDGDACTTDDHCSGGDCVPGLVVECDEAEPCTVQPTCDPATGSCSAPSPAEDGTSCPGGVCQSGACQPSVTACGTLAATVDCAAHGQSYALPVQSDVATLGFTAAGAASPGMVTIYLSLPNQDPVYAAEVLAIGAETCGPLVPAQKSVSPGLVSLKFSYGAGLTYAIKLYRDFTAGTAPLLVSVDAACL